MLLLKSFAYRLAPAIENMPIVGSAAFGAWLTCDDFRVDANEPGIVTAVNTSTAALHQRFHLGRHRSLAAHSFLPVLAW